MDEMEAQDGIVVPSDRRWIFPAALMLGALAFASLRGSGPATPPARAAAALEEVTAGARVKQVNTGNDAVILQDAQGHARQINTGNDIKLAQQAVISQSPHIILFTVDDMGWNDVGYLSTDIPEATPYMTALAKAGITLTNYYAQPSCTPSRVAIMTGKFPYRNGFQNYELQHEDAVGVPLSNVFLPAHLRALGYATAMVGKWNVGHCSTKYMPQERGFDTFLGYFCPGHGYTDFNCGMGALVRDMVESSRTVDDAGAETFAWATGAPYLGTYDTLLYQERAVAAIAAHAAAKGTTPLFLWAAQHGIHGELDSDPIPPDDMLTAENHQYLKTLTARMSAQTDEEEKRFFKMRKITATVLMSLDNSLKAMVNALEEAGMLSSAVVFVNSDNGGDTVYTKGHPGNNYPLRSEKFSYFEGGVRVPAFVYAPGIIPAAKAGTAYHGLMHHVDLVPTFVSVAGGDAEALIASIEDMDGLDHWAALLGGTTSPRRELVLNLPRSKTWRVGEAKTDEGVALRVGDFKLLLNHPFDSWFAPNPGVDHHDSSVMMASLCKYNFYSLDEEENMGLAVCVYSNFLFDLASDPHERTNLFDSPAHAPIKAALIARAEALCAAQTNDYGSVVPQTYMKHPGDPSASFTKFDDFVVPWNCETIP